MYDLEFMVPVALKNRDRLEDFKKFGLVNLEGRKVLLSPLLSGGDEIPGLEEGWPAGVTSRPRRFPPEAHYIQNMFSFVLGYDTFDSRWLIKVDDDSCTDVGSLLANLDEFYDSEREYYLAAGLDGNFFYDDDTRYSDCLGPYKKLLGTPALAHEVECSVMSRGCLRRMRESKEAMKLLETRSRLPGGVGDCAFALAASLAKVYPLNCPFLSANPDISNFSLFGGLFCHIHQIRRREGGENLSDLRSEGAFAILERFVNGPTEIEKSIAGKRFVHEGEKGISIYEFFDGNRLNVKFDDSFKIWMERDGKIVIFKGDFPKFNLDLSDSKLVGDGMVLFPFSVI